MNISSLMGVLLTVTGIVTALYKGVEYLRSEERDPRERLATVLVMVAVVVAVGGVAYAFTQVAEATPVGRTPVPFIPTLIPASPQQQEQRTPPGQGAPVSPSGSPTTGVTPTPTATSAPTVLPSPESTPIAPLPTLSPGPSPSPQATGAAPVPVASPPGPSP